MATKYVYFFGNGDADGDESMRAELGGKGANLAQMAKKPLSLPVPPGFTITTDVCQEFYKLGRKYPAGLEAEVDKYLAKLEKAMGKKLGDEKDPLLVSVRSGAAISMPGMMASTSVLMTRLFLVLLQKQETKDSLGMLTAALFRCTVTLQWALTTTNLKQSSTK